MSFVQKSAVFAQNGVTTTGATVVLTGVTAGNLLVAVCSWAIDNAGSIPTIDSTSVTAGWKKASESHITGGLAWETGTTIYFLANAGTGSNTLKLNFPFSTRCNTSIEEWAGYATTAPLNGFAVNTATSATTLTVSGPTTTAANCLIIAASSMGFASGSSNVVLTDPPSGYTSRAVLQNSNTYCAFEVASKEITSTGVQSATWAVTGVSAQEWAGTIAAFSTTPNAAATLSSATPSGTIATPTTATIGCTTNQASGTLYVVVDSAANLSGVTVSQVKAGQKAAGTAALASGNAAVSTTTPSVGVTGLTTATLYSYAIVQNNTNGDTTIATGTFTTHAALPAISGVSSMTPADGSSLTLTGTNFGTSQGAGSVTLGGVTQAVTAWSTGTSITITVSRGTGAAGLPYGVTENLIVTDNAGDASSAFAITSIQPASGYSFVNLGTPNATSANRITAVPGLASGNQLTYQNLSGAGTPVTVSPDATFVEMLATSPFLVQNWVSGSGLGTAATQTINAGSAFTGVGGIARASLVGVGGIAVGSLAGVGGQT